MKLDDALSGVTSIGVDTPAIIYFIEAHPLHDPIVTAIFNDIASGRLTGVTSAITITEVLAQPFLQGNAQLQQLYLDLLLLSDNFEVVPIDTVVAERAADFRARYGLRTPDALQIAAVLNADCEAFVTNDKTLRRVTELRILIIDELVV